MLERVVNEALQYLGAQGIVAPIATVRDDTVTIANPMADSDRHIELRIRADSDLEVAFIVPSKPGSPFEQVFSGPTSDAGMVRREAFALVSDLVAERIVLAWDARPLGGGRRFLKASDLNPETLRHMAWVVSWRGTHDWNAPAV